MAVYTNYPRYSRDILQRKDSPEQPCVAGTTEAEGRGELAQHGVLPSLPAWPEESSPASVFCAVMDKLCSRGYSASNSNTRCRWYEYITKCILPTVITEVTNFRKVHYSSIPMPSPWLDPISPISPISKLILHKHVF